jgi:hypothetical protein
MRRLSRPASPSTSMPAEGQQHGQQPARRRCRCRRR